MAELLKIQPIAPQIATGQVRIQPAAASHIGRGLTQLGAQMMRAQEREQEQQDIFKIEGQINRLHETQSDLSYGPNGALTLKGQNVFNLGEPLVDTYGRQYDQRIQDLEMELENDNQRQRFRIVAGRLRNQFVTRLKTHEADQGVAVRDSTFKGIVASETEALARALDNPDPNSRMEEMRFSIGRVRGNARNYYERELGLSAEQVDAETLKVESGMHSAVLVRHLENNDPIKARTYYELSKSAMTVPDRDNAIKAIEAGDREAKQRAALENAEQKDAINKQLLGESEKAGANLSALRLKVLNDIAIPADVQRFWVDRLNDMIEKKAKGGPDPYMKSDGRTLATVMQGVLTNPEQWTTEKVLGYMGRGLSVPHALQAAGQLKQLHAQLEKSPRGTDPLQNAIKSLDYYRDQKVFIPEEKRKAFTPQDLVENDLVMQRLMDKLVERAERNEDPQLVLNELMQPFFEEQVRGYFDFVTGRDPAKEQAERVEARQFLARAGLAISDENIKQAIDHLRKKKSGQAQPVRGEY